MELEQILNQSLDVDNEVIFKLIRCIDLTSLSNTDTEKSIDGLIENANKGINGVYPAAVCVYPHLGTYVRNQLNKDIKVAVVSSSFPTSQTFTTVKITEANTIAQTPVDEVDIVINRGDVLSGNYKAISDEIETIKGALKGKHLKVILETGELKTEEHISKAAQIAIEAGADFIKTSTGKTEIGATPEAAFTMCHVIQKYYHSTGKKIGFKPSGGIRSLDGALNYYKIVKHILGEDWFTPDLFRIGASSLYDNLKAKIQ